MPDPVYQDGLADGLADGRREAIKRLRSDDCYYAVAGGKPGLFEVIKAAADWLEAPQPTPADRRNCYPSGACIDGTCACARRAGRGLDG